MPSGDLRHIRIQRTFRPLLPGLPIPLERKDAMLFGERTVVFDFLTNTLRDDQRVVATLHPSAPNAHSIRSFSGKIIGDIFELDVTPSRIFRSPSLSIAIKDPQTRETPRASITHASIHLDYPVTHQLHFRYNGINDVSLDAHFAPGYEILALAAGCVLLSHIIAITPA